MAQPDPAASLQMKEVTQRLKTRIYSELGDSGRNWLENQLSKFLEPPSARDFYMTYTLIGRNIPEHPLQWEGGGEDPLDAYLHIQRPDLRELTRIYILASALESAPELFVPKVAKLIEVADTGELVTFLKFLPLLPHNEAFKFTAVEALRTNIATVFDAIALENPYPAEYFNDQQWNQMFLKAAFMQRDLLKIPSIARRANPALARIISDYAHERWAASRAVDPAIWRPVGPFVEGAILSDMQRLLASDQTAEQRAGVLCCRESGSREALALLAGHPLHETYKNNPFGWEDLND